MKPTTLLLSILIFIGCTAEPESQAEEVHRIIEKNAPELKLSVTEIEQHMNYRGGVLPCQYDFNTDGVVNSFDLIHLLSNFGEIYTMSDLIELLSVYGEEYIVDIIPASNNFIQDFNCNLGWDVFIRKQCGGIVSNVSSAIPYEIEWLHEGEVISTNRMKLDFQNYNANGDPLKECAGWQPPCNGINEVTMRVSLYGNFYERTAEGWVRTNNFPASIPICGFPSVPNLFTGDFLPLEFLVD